MCKNFTLIIIVVSRSGKKSTQNVKALVIPVANHLHFGEENKLNLWKTQLKILEFLIQVFLHIYMM